MQAIRIGTRGSMLAMAQARIVADALTKLSPGLAVETVPLVTKGDLRQEPLALIGQGRRWPLTAVGDLGKGLFTSRLEEALRGGEIDLAVHSAKDVPVDMAADLAIAAVPPRADPADTLVSTGGWRIEDLPRGARVATGSLRRRAQLLALRPDLAVVPIRGNVESRLARVLSPDGRAEFDAAVLAAAGLERSGLLARHGRCIRGLDPEAFVPAAGQGALLVQCLAGAEAAGLAVGLSDPPSFQAVTAERSVLAALKADCHGCIAVYVAAAAGSWRALGVVARADGGGMVRASAEASAASQAADLLVQRLRGMGAESLLASPPDIAPD
jgi:hydroxymethylbilane synthase